MSEGGHNTAPHIDSHGLATWITVEEEIPEDSDQSRFLVFTTTTSLSLHEIDTQCPLGTSINSISASRSAINLVQGLCMYSNLFKNFESARDLHDHRNSAVAVRNIGHGRTTRYPPVWKTHPLAEVLVIEAERQMYNREIPERVNVAGSYVGEEKMGSTDQDFYHLTKIHLCWVIFCFNCPTVKTSYSRFLVRGK